MRKIFSMVCVLIVALSLTGCDTFSTFDGSRTGNDTEFIMEYSVLNTTDSQELSAEAGDTIHVKMVAQRGELSVKIQKADEPPVYEEKGITASDEFDVSIDESGIYTVTVTGEKAKGSVCFTVESNS